MTLLYRDARAHADPNGNSVVTRLDLGGRRILLAGDAEGGDRASPATAPATQSIEGQLTACCSTDLRSDVLIVGHHGSLTSSRSVFLIDASIFAISSGPHPYSGVVLPDAAVVTELAGRGQVFRTNLENEACEADTAKVGPDADESPGGCKNILISIGAMGELAAAYNELAD